MTTMTEQRIDLEQAAMIFEHARELAQTHPHLKYGGEIDVRPLDLHD